MIITDKLIKDIVKLKKLTEHDIIILNDYIKLCIHNREDSLLFFKALAKQEKIKPKELKK